MRALTRPLAAAALTGVALLAVPAHAAPDHAICNGEVSVRGCTGDLFRPCGPLVACP